MCWIDKNPENIEIPPKNSKAIILLKTLFLGLLKQKYEDDKFSNKLNLRI